MKDIKLLCLDSYYFYMSLDDEFKELESESDLKKESFLKKEGSNSVGVVHSINEDGTYRVFIEDGLEVEELESATFEELENKFDLVHNDITESEEDFLKEIEEAASK